MTELTLPLSIIASLFLFVGGLVFFRSGRVLCRSKRQKQENEDWKNIYRQQAMDRYLEDQQEIIRKFTEIK